MTLPNFLIIGAAKAGTTSLYHYLREHPDVYMSPVKEARYSWYEGESPDVWKGDPVSPTRTRAAYERLFDGVTTQRAVGEASPQYLNSETAPERIAADIPRAKLIVSLRNPADRAYSSYLGRLRSAGERRGVDEALRPGTYYFETSLYHPRLLRYFERFDRSRIRVIVFDDLVANAGGVMRDLDEFLEIDPTFVTDTTERHNAALVPRPLVVNEILYKTGLAIRDVLPRPLRGFGVLARVQRYLLHQPEPLPGSIRRRLLRQFQDDIAETSLLIGRDLSHWLD